MTDDNDQLQAAADWYLDILAAVEQTIVDTFRCEHHIAHAAAPRIIAALARQGFLIERNAEQT